MFPVMSCLYFFPFDVSNGRCWIIVLIPDDCLPFYITKNLVPTESLFQKKQTTKCSLKFGAERVNVAGWSASICGETDNCPSRNSGMERMAIENIPWSISTKECMSSDLSQHCLLWPALLRPNKKMRYQYFSTFLIHCHYFFCRGDMFSSLISEYRKLQREILIERRLQSSWLQNLSRLSPLTHAE